MNTIHDRLPIYGLPVHEDTGRTMNVTIQSATVNGVITE